MNTFINHGMVFLGSTMFRATALLGAAALLAVLLRASAAVRHLVWTLGLLGALCVPLLSAVLPRLALPLFAGPWAESRQAQTALPPTLAPSSSALETPLSSSSASAPLLTPRAKTDNAAASPGWAAGIGAVWLLGFALALARLCAGWKQVQKIEASSSPLTSKPLIEAADAARRAMPAGRAIAFRQASEAAVPMSWGARRPVVVLPAEAAQWPPERVYAALLHEMAHVRRGDWLVQTLLQIACAVYWFHPLAWLAARRARTESEHACDNLVLTAGIGASDYAGHLVEVVRGARARRAVPLPALAMAVPSALERRLSAVLDSSAPRGGRTPGVMTAALIAIAACVCGASSLGFVSAASPMQAVSGDLRGTVVVVDAGHGGTDTGAVGAGGVMEKTVNLAIAQKLRAELEHHGATVLMTRQGDEDINLTSRAQLANARHADYLVSIHCDNRPPGDGGARIFYHGNAASLRQLAVRVDMGLVFATHAASSPASDFTRFPLHGFAVLRNASMPAVLVECGNMPTPQDLARLQSPQSQGKIAEGIAAGLAAFRTGGSASETENHFLTGSSTAKWLQEVSRAALRSQQQQAAHTKAWNAQHPQENQNNF